ncbi:bifunctional glycosyl transferase/transpeptidase [Enterobacter hormaechei]|jgi:penicillin-binding protein 1B|uniref:bifunctional glycosyl transferase/transpeptidase n=1 Tax=Enterobacter cloacae complex TaxID=354276 RepID=UPI0007916938|nr:MULTISPECIES: bifunctional glycosyl transferase/transpeptidase [Enterobacter cloacae complex]MCU2331594.1 bifunctional glycosyl transferase/transpeptidase [Enterobacter hormaechei subsp. steigerwaltii]EHF4969856.1 bifunctional glycosyl transferase/transpeptidase [Enterobacter hormaechei]EHN8953946.1 bifunctional glycosyl transferase/transpeptidase [Enterobacter hormaechei]ELC6348732.1 bifunctional glycosyl transferase/transpeptidase [Enterobacter hormaechei]ELD3434803.1 bifunctional glycosy
MAGNDREPIGRKGKPTRPAKEKVSRRRLRDEEYDDDYEDDYEDEEPMPRKGKGKGRKPRGKRGWFWLLLKLFIVFVVLIAIYGVYLDQKIRSRIDGKVWQLPAAVYGRMVNLEPDMSISKNEMVKLLQATQYRQVTKMTRPGEFTVLAKSIEMIRRPFDFPDSKEGQVRARLTFDGDRLETIENMDNDRQFGFFRLDPRLITMLSSANGEQRLFVARNGFPDLLVDTLLATEDRHFYEHDGISLYSIGRAVLANLTAGRTVQGASTLTQQLVKNLFLSSERSYWRKANEAYMAVLMDARYSKDRILELYMNEVYLGQSGDNEIRGFPLASLYYFGRPVEELSLDQQALLVGMVKGASIYNPWRNPKLALERRNLVLRLLQQQQVIDQELYDMLSARPLGVQPRGGVISPQPAFMQMVRQELQSKLGDKVKDLSGVKIFTTFDSVAQDAAEKAAVEGIPALKKQRKLSDLETAMVVVDRNTGEVRAMVGGAEPQFAGYNRAMQARRSIGSLAKPATYLTALSQPNLYRLNTWIADAPISLRQPNGQVWSPQNDDRQFSGQVMLVDALTRSMNVPTVNLGMALGLPAITDTWQKLGVPKDQLHPVPAMILGALNLTPIEVAQAFQTIASGGNRAPLSALRSVIAEDGSVLYQSFPQAERAVPAQAAYMTLWTMQQVVQRGTGRQLGAKYPGLHLAGKTGTTNNNVDTWFAGIDGREVVITWVGRDNNQPTKLYGASGAMSIYQRYLANQSPVPLNLVAPEDIVDMGVDASGNFICGGGMRTLPVWTTNPDALCQQSQPEEPTGNPFDQSSQPQQPQQQQPQQQNEKKDSDGVAGWIKDMFGGN